MTASIAAALSKAQAEMGKALKQTVNPHFRSKYADLGNVMDACLPALNAHGIAVIQPVVMTEHGNAVRTTLIHESGEMLHCDVPLMVQKNDMQGLGSAITYARRYGLMAMAGIAPEDDDGNAATRAAPKAADKTDKTDKTAVDEAISYISGATDLDDLKARWKNLPVNVASNLSVIRAKDSRKAEWSAPPVDDEIPY